MKSHLLRWALTGITAVIAITFASTASPVPAGPRKTVIIGPGDSIDSLARRFHVAIKDIARANHISPDAVLVDGRKLIIPNAPKATVHAITMRRQAWVKGDRISVRLGPDEEARRLTLLDHGAPVLATAHHGDWTQVKLASGKIGWIHSDLLKIGSGTAPHQAQTSRKSRVARARHARRTLVANVDEESSSGSAKHRARMRAQQRREAAREEEQRHRKQLARRHRQQEVARAESHRKRLAARARAQTRVADRRSQRGHSRPEADAPEAGSDVVRTAYAYRGTPYHFGGSGRRGFDCSGFTSYVYAHKGVNLPHSAADQFNHGRRIDSGHLKEGDLVFFHTTRRGISHVGIYAGNGKFVHASSAGGRVRVDNLSSGYYRERFRGARRVR